MFALEDECRLAFCVGVGGVGKTTFAAALGLSEALRGRSVLVLTADPARRLADALGIRGLQDVPSNVSIPRNCGGELHAAMLETKASADAIIRRAAHDEVSAQRVLDNRIYQAFSNTLARSHAYAAMERVYETMHDSRYDLVVIDTPPAQSSVEILDAPDRLVRFLDQRVARWFLQASGDASGRPRRTLAQRLLRTVAGESLVSALTEFLTEMSFMREGFAERATAVRDVMRSSEAKFVLVSSADSVGIQAARSVAEEVASRQFSLDHIVFNRAFIAEVDLSDATPPVYPERLASLAPKLAQMHETLAEEQGRKHANMLAFCEEHASTAWKLPEATRPLGDPSALAAWIALGRLVEGVS
jgi:anion-transporting  ArsA/GET3 family ATPase